MTDKSKQIDVSIPGEWALKKVLGPTLEELGTDMKKLYQVGRDKIIKVAAKKVKDIDDKALANLRVARDVFWNGAYTDEAICAEYFGGILAAARSQDGKDDSGIFYVDIIKSLSSSQLHLHYVIFRSLNKLMQQCEDGCHDVNVAQDRELDSLKIYFSVKEIKDLGINYEVDLEALYRKGLLGTYEYKGSVAADIPLPYVMARPTTLGIQLYAISSNQFNSWRKIGKIDFGDFEDIAVPKQFAFDLKDL